MIKKAVLVELFDVVPALQGMELDRDRLQQVVYFADSQRALCTANDVRGFDLITMNDKAARGLREAFCGPRWESDETDNQAGIRNPYLKLRIIPCNFDRHAGNPAIDPTNRVLKGEASSSKTACNRTGWIPGLPIPQPALDEYTTWVLGMYAEDNQPIGAELSLPLNFSARRYTRLLPRIIIMSGDERRGPIPKSSIDRGDAVDVVDIAVKRK